MLIYNLSGQLVETMIDEDQTPGNYSITWDASNEAGGNYWCQLVVNGDIYQTGKIVMVK